jgi:hypothetical protein
MRLSYLIAALVIAGPIGVIAGTASAQRLEDQSPLFGRRWGHVYEGRWCARQDAGGDIQEDCSFDSFEACRLLVIQGNRGFCTQNPAWAGPERAPPPQRTR